MTSAATTHARPRSPSPPRERPRAQPEDVYGDDVLVEEEAFSWYDPDEWYPVKIGDVFESRYQVLLKLGFGSVSTAWLCRDLKEHRYVTLKIYQTGHRQSLNESKVLQHLASVKPSHPGRNYVRLALDSFELPGKKGPHVCIVHEPLAWPLATIRQMAGGKVPESILKPAAYWILQGLDYLHSVAKVVHTDIQEGNIMLSVTDDSILDSAVNEEWTSPGPRKVQGDREIYVSRDLELPDEFSSDPVSVITDFGDAQFGDAPFIGEVMPDLYRAPEIILYIPWDEKIDIWAFGLMIWDLYEGKHLFTERLPNREESKTAHLARMVSLLGPPPRELLDETDEAEEYFNPDGTFKFPEKLSPASLEEEEENLEGEEKARFLAFIRRMLQWRPQDRASAAELLKDPWLELK